MIRAYNTEIFTAKIGRSFNHSVNRNKDNHGYIPTTKRRMLRAYNTKIFTARMGRAFTHFVNRN